MKFLYTFILIFCTINLFGQYKISINLPDSNVAVQCYFPFANFANDAVPTPIRPDKAGYCAITVEHSTPVMIQLKFNANKTILCAVKGDSVHIVVERSNEKNRSLKLYYTGTNASGFDYYHRVYKTKGSNRRNWIEECFKDHTVPADTILENVGRYMMKDAYWIDSLLQQKEITADFARLFQSEIISDYAFWIKMSGKKYIASLTPPQMSQFGLKVKTFLEQRLDKEGIPINSCISAVSYYNSYYTIGRAKDLPIQDTSQLLIVSEFRQLADAPANIRSHVIGSSLIAFREIVPTMFPYCDLYKKYVDLYDQPEIEAYMKKTDPCVVKDTTGVLVKNAYESSVAQLLQNHFKGKRLYIDLWATWCIPCKMEFVHYNNDLYEFFKQYNIENVFLSIDEDDRHYTWREEVRKLQLSGYHIRLNSALRASVKADIFDGGTVSIPRYLLVDEQGRIISMNANRPAEIKAEVTRLFVKK
jgi:thiol-disulfide isomerase/thioredoxin